VHTVQPEGRIPPQSSPPKPFDPDGLTAEEVAALTPARVVIVSGHQQKGKIGEALKDPLIVKVLNSDGEPLSLIPIEFRIVEGEGRFEYRDDQTGMGGEAVAEFVPESDGRIRIECFVGADERLMTPFVGIVEEKTKRKRRESSAPPPSKARVEPIIPPPPEAATVVPIVAAAAPAPVPPAVVEAPPVAEASPVAASVDMPKVKPPVAVRPPVTTVAERPAPPRQRIVSMPTRKAKRPAIVAERAAEPEIAHRAKSRYGAIIALVALAAAILLVAVVWAIGPTVTVTAPSAVDCVGARHHLEGNVLVFEDCAARQ